MGAPVKLLVVLSLFAGFDAQARCSMPNEGSEVLYGGQRDEAKRSSVLVCAHPFNVNLRRKNMVPAKGAGAHEMRLAAADNGGVALILSRELVHTQAELAKARQSQGDDPLQAKQKIHRLEGDIAALQAELSRVHKR